MDSQNVISRVFAPSVSTAGSLKSSNPEKQLNVPKGDPRFHNLLREIGDLHDLKQADYGSQRDPFANVRASEDFGIPAWVGTMVRANDKMHRIKAFAQAKVLKNESVRDSLMDLAVYSLMALILFDEEHRCGV